jgi:hypothetical protein
MVMTSRLAIFAILAGATSPIALAQASDPVEGILACRSIENIEARLECFDAAAVTLATARETGDVLTVTREDVEAVERDSFGFSLPSLPRFRLPQFAQRSAERTMAERTHDALEGVDVTTTEDATDTASAETVASAGSDTSPAPATPASPPAEAQPEHSVQILERNEDGGVERIVMNIERTRVVGYNTTIFYMENGQVWRQIDSDRVRLPRNSDTLTAEVRRGAMGSYLLRVNGGGRAIRVRRER